MPNKLQILIADDHTMIRDALKNYFIDDTDIEIIGEAINGKDALDKIKTMKPDLVLTDINMPVIDGHQLVERVKEEEIGVKIIALTMINETQAIKKMLSLGVDGYVLKNCDRAELKAGMQQVMNGESYYSPHVMHKVMDGLAKRSNQERTVMDMPLSSREKEVLELILKEYTNNEIANELFISVRTVDAHKRNLLEKTGSKNMVGLVIYALEKGLV